MPSGRRALAVMRKMLDDSFVATTPTPFDQQYWPLAKVLARTYREWRIFVAIAESWIHDTRTLKSYAAVLIDARMWLVGSNAGDAPRLTCPNE